MSTIAENTADDQYHIGPLRQRLRILAMLTILMIETHQPEVRFVMCQSQATVDAATNSPTRTHMIVRRWTKAFLTDLHWCTFCVTRCQLSMELSKSSLIAFLVFLGSLCVPGASRTKCGLFNGCLFFSPPCQPNSI